MAVRGFILAGVTAGGTIHSRIVPLRSFIPVADLNRSGDESGARGLSRAATPGPGFPLRGVDCYPPAARLGFLLAIHRGDRPLRQPRRPTRQPPLSEMGVGPQGRQSRSSRSVTGQARGALHLIRPASAVAISRGYGVGQASAATAVWGFGLLMPSLFILRGPDGRRSRSPQENGATGDPHAGEPVQVGGGCR